MTMTNDRMVLLDLIEKNADTDLVRAMLAFAAQRLMTLEAVVHGSGARAQCPLPRSGLMRCGRTPGVPAPACGSGPGPPRPSQSPDAHPYASAARPRSRA